MAFADLRIDFEGEIPVYRQIADGIREAMSKGTLRPGMRLPPTRDLARRLGVNRNTVVAAYERLASEGLVRSQTGRGTFVVRQPASARVEAHGSGHWEPGFAAAVEAPAVRALLSAYRVAVGSTGIAFASSYPAPDLLPVDAFRRAMSEVLASRGPELLSYGPMGGLPELRGWILNSMEASAPGLTEEQILVTNGSQQALELAFRTFLDPGDAVVVESPTFTGALSALGSLGARLVPVPVDDAGIRTDLLRSALERHRPRLVYLQPDFQNPTTAVLSLERRHEVLDLARRYHCAIVEDGWAQDLRLEGRNLPSLHALDGGRRVVYVSTFSKKLMPGLRIGWAAAPRDVLERMVALKQVEDCGTSPLLQASLHAFLEQGGLTEHLDRVLPVYRRRRDRMLESLDRHFPEGARWSRPEGGLFVWVRLPEGADTNALFLEAREQGLWFSRGELFHADGSGRHTLRLTFASVDETRIEEGIAKLGALVRRNLADERAGRDEAVEALPIF